MNRIGTNSLWTLCAALLAGVIPSALSQDNWPRFRGPNADGVAQDDSRLPEVWDPSNNVKWSTDLPGWGWSSPVVWGGKVFLTTVVDEEENLRPQKGLYLGEGMRDPAKGVHHWMVYCFDRDTGAVLWKREAHTGNPKVPRHPKNTYAAETPTTDGKRLYVLFGDLGLHCYDLDGDPVWSHPIEPRKTFMDYGAAASPVVHDGQVFVVYDNLEASWIASFDAATGRIRWKQARDEERSWATPLVWDNELRTEIVVPGKNRNRSYSLTGEVLWEFDGDMSNLVIPSPFAAHGLCYIASGYVGDAHRPTFAISPGAMGDITPSAGEDYADRQHIEWHQPKASPYNTTQMVYGDYLYTVHDQGFLTCHNARTGQPVYGKKRFQPAASFTASPWAYNGYLFCLSEDGQTFVLKAGPKFEIVTVNNLDELCLATPAIADGRLFIRTASKLYCISGGTRAKELRVAPDASQRASAALERAVDSGEVAGAAHLVVVEGKVAHRKVAGFSDIWDQTPFKADSLVRIYSMTKPVTSVAAMVLHEQGKFDLDDPVARFIPAFARTTVLVKDGDTDKIIPADRQITVRDVLRHTTGYSYGDEPEVRPYYEREGLRYHGPSELFPPETTIEEAAAALARVPALHYPGERFTYGFNTDLLGRLIEVWSGRPLDVCLREMVFEPLQMVDTGFRVAPGKRHRLTTCYLWENGRLSVLDKAAESPFNEGFEFLSGGGGLVSTLQDYANFCQMLVDGGEFRGKRLLEAKTVRLMFSDQLDGVPGDFRFGLGFAISDIALGSGEQGREVRQYSWGGYASTEFRLIPEARTFQIFLQQRVPYTQEVANRLFGIIHAGLKPVAESPDGTRSPAHTVGETSANVWSRVPDMAVPRWEAGTVALDDKLCVFGGYEMPIRMPKGARSCRRGESLWSGAWPAGIRSAGLMIAFCPCAPVVRGRSSPRCPNRCPRPWQPSLRGDCSSVAVPPTGPRRSRPCGFAPSPEHHSNPATPHPNRRIAS